MKIIIAGNGKVGSALAKQLSREEYDLTLIDINDRILENIAEQYDVMVVQGNCAAMKVLEEAGVKEADLLIATVNFDTWPAFSKALLLALMIVGACAGSTGGGFKCGRVLLLLKNLVRNVRQMVQPQRIQKVQVNGHAVDEKILNNTNGFLAAYACILVVSCLLISINGYSITTNLSAVLACFNNIGPGLELVGPVGNFAMFNDFSKLVLIFDMLAGRLEIFPILVLFSRSAWKHR